MTEILNQESKTALPNKTMILVIACIAQFMVVLDLSIVNVALPSIKTTLGFSSVDLQWILNSYTLSFAGLLLLGGRVGDIFGRRRVFLFGLILFGLASLFGAVASRQWEILFARTLQGVGAAVLSPATLTIITTTFTEGRERARALGAWSAVAGAGGAAGALFGGILTYYLSWRWTFLINVPIGILVMVLTRLFLGELKSEAKSSALDIVGSLLVTVGLTALVFGLVQGGNLGWTANETLASFAASVVLLGTFLYYENYVAKAPIVPLGLFRLRALSVANAAMFMVGGSIFASWYFLSLYMQEVLGYTPLRAGLAFVPETLAIIVGAQISSRVVTRVGVRPLIVAGPLITALGLVLLASITPTSGYLDKLLIPSILITLGMGLTFTPLAISATSGVARPMAGLASGLLNTSRQIGGAVGLAGLSSLSVAVTNSSFQKLDKSGHIIHHSAVLLALSDGYGRAMLISAGIAVIAAVIALFMPASGSKRALQPEMADSEAVLGFEGA